MSATRSRVPKLRLHTTSGQAVVTLNRRNVYCGKYGTEQSRQNYDRVIAEWLGNNRMLPPRNIEDVGFTIVELIARWLKHAEIYYRRADGTSTGELATSKAALRPLNRLYGNTQVDAFGSAQLRALQQAMIGMGWSRRVINSQIGRIRRLFKWAVEHELYPPQNLVAIKAVAWLQISRTTARELPAVKPVAADHARAIYPFVAPQVAAMIELQLLTGMRPGEVVIMRACDIDTSAGDVWTFRPSYHKMAYTGEDRVISIGPRAQEILRPWFKPELAAYLFSAEDAVQAMRRRRHELRETPLQIGNAPGSVQTESPKRPPGNRYTTESYRRAIDRGCDRAFPPPAEIVVDAAAVRAWKKKHRFAPNQLRHTAGTETRKRFGLDGAQAVLGHKSVDTSQIYAERNRELSVKIAAEVG